MVDESGRGPGDQIAGQLITNPDCFYLGGLVQMVSRGSEFRIGGFGEPYCIMMRRLPCPGDCPDRKSKG
jgi:hypothetical protein